MRELTREMKSRARIARGLLNLLQDEIGYISKDVDNHDIASLVKSIEDARATMLELDGHLSELDYLTYISRRDYSRL